MYTFVDIYLWLLSPPPSDVDTQSVTMVACHLCRVSAILWGVSIALNLQKQQEPMSTPSVTKWLSNSDLTREASFGDQELTITCIHNT